MSRRITSAVVMAMFAVIASVAPAANAGTPESRPDSVNGSTGNSTGESAVPGAAQQIADWEGCPAGTMCLFAGKNGTGGGYYWHPNTYTSDFRVLPCVECTSGPSFNDEATSWWNRTGQNFCVSAHILGGDPDNTTPVNTRDNFTPDWDNRASSIGYLGCP